MTYYYVGGSVEDNTSDAAAYTLAYGDSIYVGHNGTIAADGVSNYGIYAPYSSMSSGSVSIAIDGGVFSGLTGISAGARASISIGRSGSVYGRTGIETGDTATVTNDGDIQGTDIGLNIGTASQYVNNSGTITVARPVSDPANVFSSVGAIVGNAAQLVNATIINSGTIAGVNAPGILILFNPGPVTIVNTGTISSSNARYDAIGITEDQNADSVTNGGTIIGTVELGGGGDLYDGRKGTTFGTVYGQDGNDTLYGSDTGADILDGGAGADILNGGGGVDTASYADAKAGVTVSLVSNAVNTGDAAGDRLIGIENLIGTGFADTLITAAGDNDVDGGVGNDIIYGGSGNDNFTGGDGVDTLTYSNAAGGVAVSLALTTQQHINAVDYVTITGFENLTGSAFADMLTGDASANSLSGGAGNDVLSGGDGNDMLIGGAGNDTLTGGIGTDTVNYGDATAGVTVSLAATAAQNTGGSGTDTLSGIENLTGSNFADTLTGDAGANTLIGRTGSDTLNGGAGNDLLYGGGGDDTLNGGADTDMASYSDATAGVTVSLAISGAQDTGGGGTDTLTGIEGLTGTNYADTLTGDGNANTLIGGVGNDTVSGGGGNDVIYGGTGVDVFDGGMGTDTLTYSNASAGVTVTLSIVGAYMPYDNDTADTISTTSIENVTGSAFFDTLYGDDNANVLSGGGGNDYLNGKLGNDTLISGAGIDTFIFDTTLGATNVDTLLDLAPGTDLIRLDRGVFTALDAGTLAATAFYTGTAAHDADDRIIYDSGTGNLFYDADGTGTVAQTLFATTTTNLALTAATFVGVGGG